MEPVDEIPVPLGAEVLLDEADVFARLTPEARAFLAQRLEPVVLGGGEVLIREGDAADALYLIATGRVRVTMRRADGTVVPVAERGRGEVVGEMALVSNTPRSATVTAIRDSTLFRLPAESFLQLVRAHPSTLRELTTRVVNRLVESVRQSTPSSPVITIAVVPLSQDDDTMRLGERLHAALGRLTGAASHVTPAAAREVLGDVERAGRDRLAAWFAENEAGSEAVVYSAEPDPTWWTDSCIRQADLIVLAASASASRDLRPVEDLILGRRHRTPCRTELVLLHPLSIRDPRGTWRWLEGRSVHRHHHIAVDRDDDVERLARLLVGRGIGVVISGGGARGFASVGVLRALHELGVPIDAVGGTSVGAIVALSVARGQSPDDISQMHHRAVVAASPFDVTYPAVALAAGRRITAHLRRTMDDLNMEDTWRNVYCVSTNLTRGDTEVHRRGPCWYVARASASIPGILPPVRTATGDLLVDGGLLDNLPVDTMRAEHEGITVLAVDVGRTRDLGAGNLPADGVVSGWEQLLRRFDPGSRQGGRLTLARILMRLTELGSTRQADLGDVHIKPPVEPFGITDFKEFERLVEVGYEHALHHVGAWLASDPAPLSARRAHELEALP